jgi:hypothetical protein
VPTAGCSPDKSAALCVTLNCPQLKKFGATGRLLISVLLILLSQTRYKNIYNLNVSEYKKKNLKLDTVSEPNKNNVGIS